MKTTSPARSRLAAVAVAAGLAFASSGAFAAAAKVIINDIGVSTTADPFTTFIIAPDAFKGQLWDLIAKNGGSAAVTNTNLVSDWSNVNQTAQTSMALGTVSSSETTVGFYTTPTFNLSASAAGGGAAVFGDPNLGGGTFLLDGAFCLSDGTALDCNAAGDLTITINYDLIAEYSGADTIGATATSLLTGTVGGAAFADDTSIAGGNKLGQTFTTTISLLAGGAAAFSLVAAVEATSVPEPSAFALAALGLVGAGVARRRRSA